MARYTGNIFDFRKQFTRLKRQRTLFAFLLFDERPSLKEVEKFAVEQFNWLDNLADSTGIFFFMYVNKGVKGGRNKNPSLEVASMFGIKPNRLPGIVLFTELPSKGEIGEGVYLPLKIKFFKNMDRIETLLAELFSVIQECLRHSKDAANLLEALEDGISSLRKKQKIIPVLDYLKENLIELIKLPTTLVKSMGEAFAKEAASRMITGK